jgi:hypothetical protein
LPFFLVPHAEDFAPFFCCAALRLAVFPRGTVATALAFQGCCGLVLSIRLPDAVKLHRHGEVPRAVVSCSLLAPPPF